MVEVIYWLDMRTGIEGGRYVGYGPGFLEIIRSDPPARQGDCVAGWMIESNEDAYWAGRDNVIVVGIWVDDEKAGLSA